MICSQSIAAQTARGLGAESVMITDVSDLRLANECGIDFCVNTRNKDFGEAMLENFGPDKADVINFYQRFTVANLWIQ